MLEPHALRAVGSDDDEPRSVDGPQRFQFIWRLERTQNEGVAIEVRRQRFFGAFLVILFVQLLARGDDVADGVQGESIVSVPRLSQSVSGSHRVPESLIEWLASEILPCLLGEVVTEPQWMRRVAIVIELGCYLVADEPNVGSNRSDQRDEEFCLVFVHHDVGRPNHDRIKSL